jgi:1-deoxy-D-xylulose-5-phosphate synthase
MDVALHRLPVTFVLDRAGITGNDGPSHNGMWDMSILQLVPGMRIAAPRDGSRLRELLAESLAVTDGPTTVRYCKGSVPADIPAVAAAGGMDILFPSAAGSGTVGRMADVLLVGVGAMAGVCVLAARILAAHGIGATVLDPRWVKPLDPALPGLAARHGLVVVAEDNGQVGGVGDAVSRTIRDTGVPIRTFGIPQQFIGHGSRDSILAGIGLDAQSLAREITGIVTSRSPRLDVAGEAACIDLPTAGSANHHAD